MKKKLIYIFVILVISLFVISGCENIKGSRIDRDLDNNIDNINYRENVERKLVGDREYFLDNNLILREDQEDIEFVQTPLESELGIEQPKYYGYIIEFEDKPVIERKIELESAQMRRDEDIDAQLESYHNELISQHNGIKSAFNSRIANFDNKIKGEFFKTFNGIALDIDEEELNEIKNLPNIKNIYPNYEVKTVADEEQFPIDDMPPAERYNPYRWHLDITNVQDVWRLGYNGEGITIAIIDTGIDSNHSDLRGKVIAEHCYSLSNACHNREAEQHGRGAGMDDMGHGTHVAGIAAGNLFGAAPDADLVSIKVLNSEGSGYMSDVIKGIEIVVDPNNDNNFEDYYDIISMSLGYDGGTPDSPDAVAVDNAVNLGIVAVIAAGNSGPSYGTIGCPGCARKAITIGASDRDDNIAGFSSRGPTSIGTIKPDIVAPGILICSSRLNGFEPWEFNENYQLCYDEEHVLLSGTSMATPLVAGAVALIKDAHPNWSPAEIKMALRNTGISLGEDILTQGYGRVDVLEAVSLENALPVAELLTSGEVSQEINIIGTAMGTNFERYTLYYGEGRDPQEWIEISSSEEEINNNILSEFDTSYLDENKYTLKLLVRENNREVSEDRTLINVNNIEITNPLDSDVLRAGDVIEIRGSILNNGFENYEIEWGIGENPQEWFTEGIQLINNGRSREGVLARFDTSFIDEANPYTFRLTVNTNRNSIYEDVLIFLDPTIKEGWPKFWSGICEDEVEAINKGDVNGDGNKEIIIICKEDSYSSNVLVFDINGELLGGWPKRHSDSYTSNGKLAVADINNDNKEDIVIYFSTDIYHNRFPRGIIYVYNYRGEILGGWPIYIERANDVSSLSISDLNYDGILEIITGSGGADFGAGYCEDDRDCIEGTSCVYNSCYYPNSYIYVLNSDGSHYRGGPLRINEPSYIFPRSPFVITELAGDENKEIVFTAFNNNPENHSSYSVHKTYALTSNGEIVEGFPYLKEGYWGWTLASGDVNKNGYPEIITQGGMIDKEGQELDWDNERTYMYSGPALGDINGDGYLEIAYGDRNGRAYLTNWRGEILDGWPVGIQDYFADGIPIIADINGDGIKDILVSYISYKGEKTGLHVYNIDGSYLDGYPKFEGFLGNNIFFIDDFDGDGKQEILVADSIGAYVFETNAFYDPGKMEWPMYQHNPQHTGLYKYPFSCNEEYFMTWYDEEGNRIRQDEYDILEDQCGPNGFFRCLSNNNEISPACYNEQRCNEVCTGSNSCLDIDEWQGICEGQIEEPEERESICGNGIKEGTERCDGNDWGRIRNCTDLGYDGGRLRCIEPDERGVIPCRFDTSQCYYEERDEEIPEQQVFPGIDEESIIQEQEIPSKTAEIKKIQPVIKDINLKYSVTDNQVILEWDNVVSENNEISARTVIEVTGSAIKEGNFFSNILNAIKNLFKPKIKGIRLEEDNLYKIYKSTDINNPKQELIVEGNKEYFNCNVKCKFNHMEDEEGSYYYSVEFNGKVFSVGPVEIKKKEIIPEEITDNISYEVEGFNEEKTSTKRLEVD